MPYKYLVTNYICDKCQKKFEFSDYKDKAGIRQSCCEHFKLKLIRNLDEEELKYFISLTCCNCQKKQNKNKLNITINYNPNKKNINYNNFICCGNKIIIGAFFSENEQESINKIVNILDYIENIPCNMNLPDNDKTTDIVINNNMKYININGLNNQINVNDIIQNEQNNSNFNEKINFININNLLPNNQNHEVDGYVNLNRNMINMNNNMNMNINNILNNMNNNINMNNNMNNNINNNMNNPNNNMINNINMNNPNNNMINNINMNNTNNNMFNNMNNNINNNMNNPNNSMNNNMFMNINNILNNNMINNIKMNNTNNNMFNNMNNNININMSNFLNNNMNRNTNFNNNNQFLNGNGNGKIISFKIQFNGKKYDVKERDDKLAKDVLNDFFFRHPEIKGLIHKNQKYLIDGDAVNLDKTLSENKIKDNCLILIPFIKTTINF